jgi:hypothetical protein
MMMMSRMSYKSRFENGTEEQRASIEHPCVDFMGGQGGTKNGEKQYLGVTVAPSFNCIVTAVLRIEF